MVLAHIVAQGLRSWCLAASGAGLWSCSSHGARRAQAEAVSERGGLLPEVYDAVRLIAVNHGLLLPTLRLHSPHHGLLFAYLHPQCTSLWGGGHPQDSVVYVEGALERLEVRNVRHIPISQPFIFKPLQSTIVSPGTARVQNAIYWIRWFQASTHSSASLGWASKLFKWFHV